MSDIPRDAVEKLRINIKQCQLATWVDQQKLLKQNTKFSGHAAASLAVGLEAYSDCLEKIDALLEANP